MSFDADRLYGLLPAIYRIRDAEGAGTQNALWALIEVIASQVAVLEEDIAQLYDDQFIETCAAWVAPYIGDLIGYQALYGVTDKVGSPRAEVANTIGYRRRKGTASMLEQLGQDVTGWDVRAVEYFGLLATTQYLNHLRPANLSFVDVAEPAPLAAIGSALDGVPHTADVRSIARRRGRFDIPNVGLHAWRIPEFRIVDSPAVKHVPDDPTDGRYRFSPLGADAPLFNHALREDRVTHIATRENVPQPIGRRELWDDVAAFVPASISIRIDAVDLPATLVASSDLSDVGGRWAYAAADRALVDPVLGRLSLPPTLTVNGAAHPTTNPLVSYGYGFPAEIGGGPYGRGPTFTADLAPVVDVGVSASIAAAIGSVGGSGAVQVDGNGRVSETIAITLAKDVQLEVRAAEHARPAVDLTDELVVTLADGAALTLNGLLLFGARVRVDAASGSGTLRVRHCTLVPGIRLKPDGSPDQPGAPSLVVESPNVTVEVDHSILGPVLAHEDASVAIVASAVDATDPAAVAYAGLDGAAAGGPLRATETTVVGKVHARILSMVSNAILHARLAEGDTWPAPVIAERRQEGCVRFSYVPSGSRTPPRHACRPLSGADPVRPEFTDERYGRPAYLQLADRCSPELLTGADDESEMGVYHDLFDPQRETNLRVRLEEYLRFGLEAGIFHAS